jgi:integrase
MPKRRSTAESTPRIRTYRLHQATGQARCVIDGRTFYFGPYGDPEGKAKYRRLIAEWVANGYRLPCSEEDRDSLTISELAAAYWKDCKQRLPDKNSRSSTKAILQLLRKHYGDVLVAEFGPASVKALRLHLIRRDLLRRTINFYMARLRQCFKWAMREELVAPAVYQKVASVEALRFGQGGREADPVQPVDDDTIDATLPYMPAPVADMIRVQRHTSARPGEVRIMTWAKIDRSGKVWRFTRTTVTSASSSSAPKPKACS